MGCLVSQGLDGPNLLPVQLDLRGRACVIVGAGAVASRKAARFLEAGARVLLIAPEVGGAPGPAADADAGSAGARTVLGRAYAGPADLAGAFLVVAATGDPELNARVAADARALGALALRADAPGDSDFALPATLRRGALSVSFATGGRCPALALRLRREAEALYDAAHATFLDLVAELKADPRYAAMGGPERRALQSGLAESGLLERLRRDSVEACRAELLARLDGPVPDRGSVALVGAGPGDPGLLTLRAAAFLREAQVVVHDALVNPAILDRHAPQAERIDAGKHKGHCVLTQDAINELLVRLAREGRRVVRLKGGDPYLFGRGGEELRALRAAGVPCQVVPGVSSLSAVPAAAGIPVTDREFGTSVGAFSLHRRDGRNPDPAQWRSMAQGPDTLVLFMGLSVLPMACAELIRHGRVPELPAALVLRGTLPDQRTLVGTLATLPALLAAVQAETPGPLPGPGLIVVGEVVRLAGPDPVLDSIAVGRPAESGTQVATEQPALSGTPVAREQPDESRAPVAAGPAQVPGLPGADRPPVPPVACAAALPAPAPARPMIHQLLARPRSGADIEAGSFAVIDREAGAHGWAPDQWAVARRLVHTCADFGILEGLRFRHDAVAAGIRALRAGRPIYVDANMIRSGLSLARLRAVHRGYGPGDLHCHVADADVAEQAAESGLPRSLFALRKAAPLLEGAIVAIGNAPVALLELNRMIVEEGLRPALVVGMPVGFVHVLESKRELLALDVPAVVLEGRRGGSPLVVATLHALAGLAGEAL